MAEIDLDSTTQATEMGHRLREYVDTIIDDDPQPLVAAIEATDPEDFAPLLFCAVLLLRDLLAEVGELDEGITDV